MGTTADKLNKLLSTKAAIKQAIIDKGVDVGEDTVFADYPNKIRSIESGGGATDDFYNMRTSNGTDLRNLFYGYLGSTLNINNLDTSQAYTMSSMFNSCRNLTSLDLSNFNTSQVTDISGMFAYCNQLTSLDVSNFNTSQVTDMGSIFNGCYQLTSLDLSNFNTNQVTNMNYMFSSCQSLTELDLSNFNTSQITSTNNMFAECYSLQTLNLSNFDLSGLMDSWNAEMMFSGCYNLHTLRLDNCNAYTINMIINSMDFPTGEIGTTRKIYVNRFLDGITAPYGWTLVLV